MPSPISNALWPDIPGSLIVSVLSIWTFTMGVMCIYRITLHPLATIPGPKLAAMSWAYEFWFDVIHRGRYTHEIRRMHEKYGPIVRITPNEVHCNDPRYIDTIFASGKRRRDKSPHFVHGYPPSIQMAGVGTVSHDLHRLRRAAISKAFSRTQIMGIQILIQENAQKLCDKMLTHRSPFNVVNAYSCFTNDVISEYCLGESSGCLGQSGWEASIKGAIDIFERHIHIFRHFPGLAYLMEQLPVSLLELLWADAATMAKQLKVIIPNKIDRARGFAGATAGHGRSTILSTLLDSQLPASEMSTKRLTGEVLALMVGGTETTAVTLERMTYFILSNPDHHKKLHHEISTIVTDPTDLPSWQELEKLPFFSAVILESIRLVYGVSGRASRVAIDEDLIFESHHGEGSSPLANTVYVVPRGYPVGMSSYIMNSDESIFPDAKEFVPNRWLDKEGKLDRYQERYLLSFSKGSRQCIGIQLAYCELYVCAAALVLRVFPRLELYETSRIDVEYDHDELIGKPSSRSKGVRAKVIGNL